MLNEAQQRAVRAEGHLLVSAGPGSGKTSTMAARAEYLLRQHPNAFLGAVTFTNDAADGLRQKILSSAPEVKPRVLCGTFHALCIEQLSRAGRKCKIANEAQCWAILHSACQAEFSALAGQTIEEVKSKVDKLRCQLTRVRPDPANVIHRILVAYEGALAAQQRMDFTDLIRETVFGMKDGTVQPLPVKFLLVDEFQDSDDLQVEWALMHAARGIGVTCCGDDDQSIYGWREARGFDAMQQFLDATRAPHVKLEMSYRCAPEIIRAANALIVRNPERVAKTLRTANTGRGQIQLRRFGSEEEEASVLAETVLASTRDAEPCALEDWAVLARGNRALDVVEEALRVEGVPFHRVGGKPYWQHPGPAMLLEFLDLMATGNLSSLETILRGVGVSGAAVARLHKEVGGSGSALLKFLGKKPQSGESLDAHRVRELQLHAKDWFSRLKDKHYGSVAFSMADFMQKRFDKKALGRRSLAPAVATIGRMKGSLAQRVRLLRQESSADGKGVKLLTLHGSKGLEWPNVWIVRCEQGTLPHTSSDIYEERRLFYVGLTRAKSRLVLSRTVGSTKAPRPPSQFLDEAGLTRRPEMLLTA